MELEGVDIGRRVCGAEGKTAMKIEAAEKDVIAVKES